MFSKKPATTARTTQANAPMSGKGSTFSVFGSDVSIKGDVNASVDLHLDGKVEGDITCASLVQGQESEVFGSVKADSARLAGRVTGSISARELVILKSARIEGDVHYEALTIEQGAIVEGRFGQLGARQAVPAAANQDSDELRLKLADQA